MQSPIPRRHFIAGLGALGLTPAFGSFAKQATAAPAPLMRPIPSSGEMIPAIGMGTWITFNVGGSERLRADRQKVLQRFFDLGGGMVDSSPMYGTAEEVMGWCLDRMGPHDSLFSATKVWTPAGGTGLEQMSNSEQLWKLPKIDLQQVHNLVDWEDHLEMLYEAKDQGRIRYVGITTSHGRRHSDMAQIMNTKPLDFVQFTYNVRDREAESVLLPLAKERGIATIINRPFQRGGLFDRYADNPLPAIASDLDCKTWAAFFLKFVISHPAVTLAIPATSKVEHMEENMAAMQGPMPDAGERQAMLAAIESL